MLLVKANFSLFSYSAFLVLEIKLWNWNIVPLAMFYFSIDSEIKTSESAPKCRLFLWTFLQSVSYIEYMWYGRFGIVREQFVRTQSIWKRYRWNFGNRCAISVIFVSYQPHYNQRPIKYLSASFLRWRLKKKTIVFGLLPFDILRDVGSWVGWNVYCKWDIGSGVCSRWLWEGKK